MNFYRPECPSCGRSDAVESAADALRNGTSYQTVTDWETYWAPAGKDGQMVPLRRQVQRTVLRQSQAARRLAPPEPPSGSAASEPLGCSIFLIGGALWFAWGNFSGATALVVLGIIAACLLWVRSGLKTDSQNQQWWRETGYPMQQRKLDVLRRGWYCHDCDKVFF